MSKQSSRLSNPNQANLWQLAGGRIIAFLAALTLIILSGIFVLYIMNQGVHLVGGIIGVTILATGVSMAFERSLAILPISIQWRYRSAFFSAVFFFLALWLIDLLFTPASIGFFWFFFALIGALLGGILATSFNERLWENNSPPGAEVQEQVHQLHIAVIGSPTPTPLPKRAFDVCLGGIGLLISLPIWLASIFLIWLEDPGPLLFVKNSVGLGGLNFHQYKLRTMVRGAEEATGPVLASESDERVLVIGHLLRKTALDELPQLLNILRGEMSFVGPRPQRTVLVLDYLKEMPEYAFRHQVLPGLAGLAQVAGDYYLTPRQKLRFDRLYIEYVGLGFDLKLIALAFSIAFWFRWQGDWDGRLPRTWLRFGSRRK